MMSIAGNLEQYLINIKDKEHLKNIYLVNSTGDIRFAISEHR